MSRHPPLLMPALALLGLALSFGCSRAGRDKPARSARAAASAVEPGAGREAAVEARGGGPTLSPAAASAYAAGLAAFEKADLKAAGAQFERAIAADRGAYPALVGL